MTSSRALTTAVCIALSGLLLAACGSTGVQGKGGTVPLAGKHTNLAASWIAVQPSQEAILLTWTVSGSKAEGNWNQSSLSTSGMSIDTNSDSLTGVISGTSITITFDTGASVSGSISTSRLSIQFPDNQGVMQTVVLVPGTTHAYNSGVRSIQSVVDYNQRLASEKSAIDQAAQSVSSLVSSITSDVSSLANYEANLQGDLSALNQDVQVVQNDADIVIQDVNSNSGSACGDAGSAQGDAGSAQGDFGSLQGDESLANSYLSDLRQSLSNLPAAWSAFKSAESALPSYTSQYSMLSIKEESAISEGSHEASAFPSQEAQVTSDGQADVNTANRIAANAMAEAQRMPGGC